jgi:hypothetical protein
MQPISHPENAYMPIADAIRLAHQAVMQCDDLHCINTPEYANWPRDVLRVQADLQFVSKAYRPKVDEISVYELDLALCEIKHAFRQESVMTVHAINRSFLHHIAFMHRSEKVVALFIEQAQRYAVNNQ